MERKVIIVGGSPAAYMCGIYVHTANISPLIIKTTSRSNFDFSGSDKIAGVNAKTAEEFTALVEEQAMNMGIRVQKDDVVDVRRSDEVFKVYTSNGTYETRSLVIDDRCVEEKYRSLLGGQGVFYTNDRISHKEAIVVTGAGCKTSFDVKEFIEGVTK